VIHPLLASSRGLYAHAHTRAQRTSIRAECTRGRAAARQRFSCKFPPRGLIVISNLSPPSRPSRSLPNTKLSIQPLSNSPVADRARRRTHNIVGAAFGLQSSYYYTSAVLVVGAGGTFFYYYLYMCVCWRGRGCWAHVLCVVCSLLFILSERKKKYCIGQYNILLFFCSLFYNTYIYIYILLTPPLPLSFYINLFVVIICILKITTIFIRFVPSPSEPHTCSVIGLLTPYGIIVIIIIIIYCILSACPSIDWRPLIMNDINNIVWMPRRIQPHRFFGREFFDTTTVCDSRSACVHIESS